MNLDSKWVVERFDTAWLEWTRCTRKSSLDAVNGRGRHGRVSRRRVRVDSPLRPACRPSPHCKMSTNQNQSIALLLDEFELFAHKYGGTRTKTFQYFSRSFFCFFFFFNFFSSFVQLIATLYIYYIPPPAGSQLFFVDDSASYVFIHFLAQKE